MGTSVTAGHDSPFNLSYPVLVGKLLAPPLRSLGVQVVTLNAGISNNPCLPYDACVSAFAGPEADLIHWEHSYNCLGYKAESRVIFEQFIRQALRLPNQPIVAFSESNTPNWSKDACKSAAAKASLNISDEDHALVQLVSMDAQSLVSEVNPKDFSHRDPWTEVREIFNNYELAGVQTWYHSLYEKYKCKGPYVPDWGCCSANWHPSKLGHELRADHYAYFWLLILKDAISDIQSMEKDIDEHLFEDHKYVPKPALEISNFTDTMQCFTSLQPLADPKLSLFNLVIKPKKGTSTREPFKTGILEDFFEAGAVKKAQLAGYRDFKYMLFGNKKSQHLSLALDIKNSGYVQVCQPPGHWGNYPAGFKSFFSENTAKAFVTPQVEDFETFTFKSSKAVEVPIVDPGGGTEAICAELGYKFTEGRYVLTLVPLTTKSIMISYLILP